jgi:hypothetical protein
MDPGGTLHLNYLARSTIVYARIWLLAFQFVAFVSTLVDSQSISSSSRWAQIPLMRS